MAKTSSSQDSWKNLVVIVSFWTYVVVLLIAVRGIAHHLLHEWLARLATMVGVAIGLLPWGSWVMPRIRWTLDVVGRLVLIACYFTLMLPFALIIWFKGDPFTSHRMTGTSRWHPRQPLPNTLDAARMEA